MPPRANSRRRMRRALHADPACVVIAVTAVRCAQAQATSASGDDDDDGGDDSSGGTLTPATSLRAGALFVTSQLKNVGDAVLIRRFPKFWSGTQICNNAPFVLSKDGASNGQCWNQLNALGFSCTCFSVFKKQVQLWELHVTKKLVTTGTPAKTVENTATLQVTKIAPFAFVPTVTEARLVGKGPKPELIEFMPDVTYLGVNSTPKFESLAESKADLSTIYIENINMDFPLRNKDFFEPTITDLTLKNCGLTDESSVFLTPLSQLNTLNLQDNAFSRIPSEVFLLSQLSEVVLLGNPIANLTVTEREFQIINSTKIFSLDPSTSGATGCVGGALKATKGFTFCVSGASSSSDADSAPQGKSTAQPATSSSSTKYLVIGVISGCVIVAILVFLGIRKRSSRQKEEAFVKHQTNSIIEDTLSFDISKDSNKSVDSSLLNDPIIITHRIPYNDVKVATCISRGGFGLVYSGTFNRRRVAIKKIRSELSADIKYIESFLKEICLMASLSHPRIVEFIGVSWDSLRNLSAVTEFMERGDLRDVLHSAKARDARLTWDGHKARIAMHIAEALTYLHSLSPKVIHRDLKSKNVLLDNDMTAKLSDFGVSRERRFEETHMTAGIGTAFWIAPEVLLGMDYDEHADIFSYGVVLSEIDTDDYPYWNEKNPASGGKQQENVILRMVATGALRPEFSPTCPSPILELAHACLDVDPQKRPTAAEIVYRLQQLIRSSPLTPDSVFSTE